MVKTIFGKCFTFGTKTRFMTTNDKPIATVVINWLSDEQYSMNYVILKIIML